MVQWLTAPAAPARGAACNYKLIHTGSLLSLTPAAGATKPSSDFHGKQAYIYMQAKHSNTHPEIP